MDRKIFSQPQYVVSVPCLKKESLMNTMYLWLNLNFTKNWKKKSPPLIDTLWGLLFFQKFIAPPLPLTVISFGLGCKHGLSLGP